ncbi:FAD-binding protein [Acidocella sp.]|uniref:FAD-binding protein n=1 Tax=Acidocella sp. TaxID=50710 RepID=UPI0017DB47E8|nr:FAD-binding protein [Acidocella sp.]NNM57343.1 FAD-binding protein [Acidocella sp.]
MYKFLMASTCAPDAGESCTRPQGADAGAGREITEDCWWMPSIQTGPDQNGLALGLRALPGSIIVDASAKRYMNKARSYMATGKIMYKHGAANERHWLIMDGRFLKRYMFAELSQKSIRNQMLKSGFLQRTDSVSDLAAKCGIDPAILQNTIDRFNSFARHGVDEDFRRI